MDRLKSLANVMQSQATARERERKGSDALHSPLSIQVYNADAASFHGNAVLVCGETDAVLLGIGLSRADALRITAMVLDSKKVLKTIYVGWPDPDCHVGLDVIKQHFPHAVALATAPTLQKIETTLIKNRQLFDRSAAAQARHVAGLPTLLQGDRLVLEREVLEVRGIDDSQQHRSYVWIPGIKTLVAGLNVYGAVHLWTACTSDDQARADWRRTLDDMLALQPERVIPGCSLPDSAQDVSQIRWTRDYLDRLEAELAMAPGSNALIRAMERAYPEAGLPVALHIGARVGMGEMKW